VNGGGVARLFRFALVGVAGAAMHIGAFEIVRRFVITDPAAAWLVSFAIAATAGWAMNRRFTFRVAANDNARAGEWLRYLAVAGAGALAHFAVFRLCIDWIALFAAHPALAIVPGSLASLCVTYAGSSLFVFASARKRP
jgi:putative flippase GtrA